MHKYRQRTVKWPLTTTTIERTDEQHENAPSPRAVHEPEVERNELGDLLEVRLEAAQQTGENDQVAREHPGSGALRCQHGQQRHHDHADAQYEVDNTCVQNHPGDFTRNLGLWRFPLLDVSGRLVASTAGRCSGGFLEPRRCVQFRGTTCEWSAHTCCPVIALLCA